eukprot:GHVH01001714.1.p1 GENE.GHVH01001714.1~~GHVH01001714.1.p1  ORF type:complete len:278 (+),score=43.48 GHVH01001714.1:77-910(+)
MVRLIMYGASGRMGRKILEQALENNEIEVVGAVCGPNESVIGSSLKEMIPSCPNAPSSVHLVGSLDAVDSAADVLIDFSFAGVSLSVAQWCVANKVPLVQGTTGLTDEQSDQIRSISQKHPILRADNFSLGVNVLRKVLKDVARSLPDEYNIEVVETHHNLKKDSPSGTAFALAEAAREGRCYSKECYIYGREGMVGERPVEEIGMHAVRGGGIIGDHTVSFTNAMEQITISHRALDRDLFASGALRAALWMAQKKQTCGEELYPRTFDMFDVLNLA